MRTRQLILLAFCLAPLFASPRPVRADSPIRVGIYENAPLIFTEDSGRARGIYSDLLQYIAEEENWQIEYRHCIWSECLQLLDKGEIDLLVAIAVTEERSARFDFSHETVILNWGQLYTLPESGIESLLDLEGKRVAVLTDDIHTEALESLLGQFGVTCELIRVDEYPTIMELLAAGRVDAGLTNRLFGAQHERDYQVVRTATVFNPLDVRFALPKGAGQNAQLIAALDTHLLALKQDQDSIYYQSLDRWISGTSRWAVPPWLRWVAVGTAGLLIAFLAGNILLRSQVRTRTRELQLEVAERVRAERQQRRYAQQLAALREIGLDVTAQLDHDRLLLSLVSRAAELLGSNSGTLYLYRPVQDQIQLEVAVGFDQAIVGTTLQRGEGLAGKVWESGQPIAQDSYSSWDGRAPEFDQMELTAVLGVPIHWGEEFLGVLEVLRGGSDAFSADDRDLLSLFATQAAIAIRNARMYQETAHRLAQAQALHEVMLAATSTLDFDRVLEKTLETLQTTLEVEFLTFELADENGRQLHVHPKTIGFPNWQDLTPLSIDASVTGRVLQTGEPVSIGDVSQVPFYQQASPQVRSELAVPVRVAGQVIGVLNVESSRLHAFDQDDLAFYSTIAGQLGIALENARLFEAERASRKQAEESIVEVQARERHLTLLNQITQAALQTPDLRTTLRTLADWLVEWFGADDCYITRWDEQLQLDFPAAAAGKWRGQYPHSVRTEPGEPTLTASVLRAGRPLVVSDLLHSPYISRRLAETFPAQSTLVLPLIAGEHRLGATIISFNNPHQFTDDEIARGEQAAGQIALAIAKAQLLEETRRRAAHLDSLNTIIASAAAVTSLPDLLHNTLDEALKALGLEMGVIWLGNHTALRNLPAESDQVGSGEVHLARALTGRIQGCIAEEDWQNPAAGPRQQVAPLMVKLGIRSSLTVPLMTGDEQTGGLSLASAEPQTWPAEEVALAQAVGQQVGEAAERIRLLEKTRQQAQQVAEIIRTVPEGVVLLDADGRILTANPAASAHLATLAGVQVGDVLTSLGGRGLAELLAPPPENLWHEVALEDPEPGIYEVIARPVESGPAAHGWVLVIRDATRERAIQHRIQQQSQLAAVGQMAAGIAHDFNNIMAVITLYTQMLLRTTELEARARERLETINQQARRAGDLIQQILDFSRRAILERQTLELLPLLKEQVKLLHRTLPENIRLELLHNSEQYVVHADPTRIQQVIMNLVLNSRDAMPEGGKLTIQLDRLWVEAGQEAPLPEMLPGEWVELQVRDNGTGIPAEVLPHIFEPFFTTKAPGKGTGLGLSQVYGIIHQHEGHIKVESAPGEGTTFVCFLPAQSVQRDESQPLHLPDLPQGAGETILVVEDNTATREAMADCLASLGYLVLEAQNGRQALEILGEQSGQIALVITDLIMPEMGGSALIQSLQKQYPTCKILVVTGHPPESYLKESLRENITGWLPKPLNLDELAVAVYQALARR